MAVILVTGSSTGIGQATALHLARNGHQVFAGLRSPHTATELKDRIAAEALPVEIVQLDITDGDSVERAVRTVMDRTGRIDALVNNAAVTTRSNLETTDSALFDWIVAVNLRSPMFAIQAAVPEFRRKGGGVILNVGSINALAGESNLLAYSAAKGGLLTMSRNLANSLATEQIRVNHLNVGWVTSDNEIALKQTEGMRPGWETRVPKEYAPFGRLLTPEQVAQHILFWISDESYPANGCVYELEQYSFIGRNVSKAFD